MPQLPDTPPADRDDKFEARFLDGRLMFLFNDDGDFIKDGRVSLHNQSVFTRLQSGTLFHSPSVERHERQSIALPSS
jgi:hypothetical protein